MKIKVNKTVKKALAFALCVIMMFGAIPFAGVFNFVPGANAAEPITVRFFAANEDEPYTDKTFAPDKDGKITITPPATSKTGWSFTGWQPAIPDPETITDNYFETTAQWQINQYTITFADTGNVDYEPIAQDYGTAIAVPADPVKTGYTFLGWSEPIPTEMPAENKTITAKWQINQYTITFKNTGNVAYEPITQDYGTEITALADPVKTGYTFLGWSEPIPTEMPAENKTITAKWSIDSHKITFDADGGVFADGSSTCIVSGDYNSAVTLPENPTKTGYTFNGWDNSNIPATMPDYDLEIKAKWTANSYPITYDPNGGYVLDKDGNVTENPVVYPTVYDQVFAKPANPTRSGYTFLHWVDENGNVIDANYTIEKPTTYYAKWSEGTGDRYYKVFIYTMSENGNYNNAVPTEALYAAKAGDVVAASCNIETGFELDQSKHGAPSVFPSGTIADEHTADNPLELKVYLARKTFTISLDANGGIFADGSDKASVPALYGATFKVPNAPTKTGYTFDGWKNDATGETELIPSTMPADNMNYTAQWTENTNTNYKIVIKYKDVTGKIKPEELDANGYASETVYNGKGSTGASVKILIDGSAANDGKIYHKVSDFSLKHYEFDTSDMSKHMLEGKIAPDGSTVFELYFAPVKYNVTFKVSDKVIEYDGVVYSKDYEYYTDANDLAAVFTAEMMKEIFAANNMQGYTFTNWSPELKNITGDIEYNAVYTPNKYTVTFAYTKITTDADGNKVYVSTTPDSAVSPEITQDFNTDVAIPAQPTKAGFKFLGWFDKNSNEYKAGSIIKMPVDGLALTARFEPLPITITFKTNLDGATLKTTSVTKLCEEKFVITEDMIPSKEGYTFNNWVDSSNESITYNLGDEIETPTKNLTLVADWSAGKFMVVFKTKTNNGEWEILNDITYKDVASGTSITAPGYKFSSKQIDNRTFMGWREEGKEAGDPLFVFNKMPGRSIVLEAVWGYKVTFDANATPGTNDASLTDNKTVTTEIGLDLDLTEISDPIKTGNSFTGWYRTKDAADEPVDDNFSEVKNTTLYAGWKVNKYTVTFDANGGYLATEYDTLSKMKFELLYGAEINTPADPTKTGFTFAGWLNETTGKIEDLPTTITIPAVNTTYTAQWTINVYDVIFKDADGTVIKSTRQEYGTNIVLPENPSRVGSVFMGWSWNTGSAPETVPESDVIATARWKDIIYTITFVDGNGKVIDTVSGTYGSAIREVKTPSKWFYKFAGWDKDIPKTMPAEDIVITATWVRNTTFIDAIVSFFNSILEFFTNILNSLNKLA